MPYDRQLRLDLLADLDVRFGLKRQQAWQPAEQHSSKKLYFVTAYSRATAKISIRKIVKVLRSQLPEGSRAIVDSEVVVSYRAGSSTFRELYQMNFPVGCRAGRDIF